VSGTQPPVVPFWVTEIREKIVTTISLEFIWTDEEQLEAVSKLPEEYGYLASEWSGRIEVPIVLLEKIH